MSDPIQQPPSPDKPDSSDRPGTTAEVKPEATVKPEPKPDAPQPAQSNRTGGWFSNVTLTHLTLLLLAGLFVWQWLESHSELNQTQQQVARRLSEVEAENKANQILVARNQELVRELGGKLSLVENRTAETQNQRAALETLYQELSSGREQIALAEVEQMLLIAGQQLQLSSNVKAALIALQQAESRLRGPAFAGLRKHIGQDIDKLRALPDVDVMAINMRLEGVIAAVDSMDLAQDAQIQAQQPSPVSDTTEVGWRGFLSEAWREAKQLVRIQNTEQQELPLLPPSQTFFLRENLKLHLLTARLSLFSRDQASFRRDLKISQEWIKRYFDTSSSKCAKALTELNKLGTSSIALSLPDLSGSLEAVRNYRLSHERSMR